MRVLVTGGRNYADAERVTAVLGKLHGEAGIDLLIEGGANGADRARQQLGAIRWSADATVSPPIGRTRAASPGRSANTHMLEAGEPDVVIAFEGGRGTADMVRKARRAGVEVIEIAA